MSALTHADALPHAGSATQPSLREVFATSAPDAAATGFLLAHLTGGTVLWVQDRLSLREAGRPYPPGFGVALDILHLTLGKAADVLWAMEQGLSCPDLAAVVGEVWGAAGAVDFTATKRLALRAEAQGVACWLIRRGAAPDLSAARERWRVGALPSAPDPHDLRAPGAPIWRADLFRARFRPPADWIVRYDRAAHRMEMSHPALSGAESGAESGAGAARRRAG